MENSWGTPSMDTLCLQKNLKLYFKYIFSDNFKPTEILLESLRNPHTADQIRSANQKLQKLKNLQFKNSRKKFQLFSENIFLFVEYSIYLLH